VKRQSNAHEFEPGLSSERRELFRPILMRKLGDDFFTPPKMKLVLVDMYKLVDVTDQMHLDSSGV
jgi:hypothetical protein